MKWAMIVAVEYKYNFARAGYIWSCRRDLMFDFGAAMVPSLLSFLQKLCEAGYLINATSLFNVAKWQELLQGKDCCRSLMQKCWMNELREKDSLLFRKAGIKCHTLSHENHLRMLLAVESVKAVKAIAWHCACSVHCLKTSQNILHYSRHIPNRSRSGACSGGITQKWASFSLPYCSIDSR